MGPWSDLFARRTTRCWTPASSDSFSPSLTSMSEASSTKGKKDICPVAFISLRVSLSPRHVIFGEYRVNNHNQSESSKVEFRSYRSSICLLFMLTGWAYNFIQCTLYPQRVSSLTHFNRFIVTFSFKYKALQCHKKKNFFLTVLLLILKRFIFCL